MFQGERGRDFEESRVRLPISDELPNIGQGRCNFVFGNHLAVDTDSFAKSDKVRGDKKTGPIFLGATDRIDHRADRPLAVGAGHVNNARAAKIDMRLSNQTPNIFQPEFDPEALKAVKPGERLSVLHGTEEK